MDWACRSLVGALDGERMSLDQLVDKSGLARQTVHNHLIHLVEEGFVSKEVVRHGRGRPTVFYRKSRQPIESFREVDVVRLKFQELKQACRFEKGGWCKELRDKCSSERCPLAIKTK